jgi:hypothetical protein
MERLPRETFLLIASYLDFETRFQIAYVCKDWHSVISNHNLYETVYIDRDHNGPIDFFANNKTLGATVKSLQVNGVGITWSHLKGWPNYFPHLQNLSLAIAEVDMFSSDYEEEYDEDEYCYEQDGQCFNATSSSFKKWERLASISEFTKYMYSGSILISGKYPNLTSIDLNFNLIPDHAVDTVMDVLLIGLKSAPTLKYLKLIVAKLTLKKLNLLHHNAPSIEGLILEDIALGEDADDINEEYFVIQPQPVDKLTRLEMQGSRFSFYENETLTIPAWIDYISQKYPNIEILKMNQFTPASIEYEAPVVHVVNKCKKLKTFNVDFCHLSTSVLTAFDQTAILLEKYSSQSQDITELRNLSASKQRHSIYRLDLVVPVGNTDLIQILAQFTGLTTINTYPSSEIDYTVGKPLQLPFNTFLKHHRLLEFLSLSSCTLYMDEEEVEQEDGSFRSVLDTLEMEKVTIRNSEKDSPTVFDFISKSCPILKVLIVTARFQEYSTQSVTKLDFSNHHIVYMKVYIEGHTYIKLHQHGEVLDDNEKVQWFEFKKEGKKIKYTELEQQQEKDENLTDNKKRAGVLVVDVQQVERFVANVPRDPFELV